MTLIASGTGGVLHQAFFWLRNPRSEADRVALVAGLTSLREIPLIRALRIGLPAPTEARDVVDASFDVSETMLFDSVADQRAYQDHPLHRAFVAQCGYLWDRVVVYDSVEAEVTGGSNS
jgi:hypothetical protein